MSTIKKVTIAGAAGAWGDSALSTPQLLEDGRADYIVYEGLAEITMAILTRAWAEDPGQGYARDIIETIAANLARYQAGGMKVITNAGGVNPHAAARLIESADPSARVAIVSGDDLMGSEALQAVELSDQPMSANVYLGAQPIAAALDEGADVVVTGRVVDSALVLGPLIHEFGWRSDDFDRLSAGSLVGHLLECGPQSTGGLMTDWEETSSWSNPGYPIAEVDQNGSFVVTTPDGTDALVDERTVAEQLLYEIGDPARYLLPDVTCDWTAVMLGTDGPNRIRVSGARGHAPPPTLKGCAQIADGWRVQFLLFVGGRHAAAKARRVGGDLAARGASMLARAGFEDFRQVDIEVLGAEDTYGPHSRTQESREVILKIGLHHDSMEALGLVVREVPSTALAGPPGVSGGGAGLPRPTPLVRLQCFPVPRTAVQTTLEIAGEKIDYLDPETSSYVEVIEGGPPSHPSPYSGETVSLPLVAIAHGRSGDKGADLNIGIRARHPDFWSVIIQELTAERVATHLAHLGATDVARFELPGIDAVNFLLEGGLGAGGTASLRFDPQGKAVAQQLLDIEIAVPVALATHRALRTA